MLRQNRRVVTSEGTGRKDEIELFHRVLNDISLGHASHDVRSFFVDAYVRGASSNCAEQTPFEGSTGVFTKRRYSETGKYQYPVLVPWWSPPVPASRRVYWLLTFVPFVAV